MFIRKGLIIFLFVTALLSVQLCCESILLQISSYGQQICFFVSYTVFNSVLYSFYILYSFIQFIQFFIFCFLYSFSFFFIVFQFFYSVCTKLFTNTKRIYLHRGIEHETPSCNTFTRECQSQTYWVRWIKPDETDQNLGHSGWFVDDKEEQQSVWTALPKSSKACKELKHCSCKGLCIRESGTWKKYDLPCTDLCHCQG